MSINHAGDNVPPSGGFVTWCPTKMNLDKKN